MCMSVIVGCMGMLYSAVILTLLHMQDLNIGVPGELRDWPPLRWLQQQFNRFHAGFDWLSICSIIWQKALISNKPIYLCLIRPHHWINHHTALPGVSSFHCRMIHCCIYFYYITIQMHVIKTLVPQKLYLFYITGNLLGPTFPKMQHLYNRWGGVGVLLSTDYSFRSLRITPNVSAG